MKYLLKIIIIFCISTQLYSKKTIVKMATLVPEGTDWHGMLLEMGQRWKEATNGEVVLRIYPGGVVGDERDMIRKIRIGQIQAAAVSTEGLSEINFDVNGFVLPMLCDDYDDVDWLRKKVRNDLESKMRANGFEVLFWADVGWAKWFTTEPITSLNDLKKMKIFTWAGDFHAQRMWESAGFQSVPLAAIDILSGLQTGLINALATTPLYALSQQWFSSAKYMYELNWGILTAGVVIDKKTWDKISNDHQKKIKSIAEDIGNRHQQTTRHQDNEAVKVMEQHGLIIYRPSDEEKTQMKKYVRSWYPELRGTYLPEEIFDKFVKLMAEKDALDLKK